VCVTNGKKVINFPKLSRQIQWFWDAITTIGLEPLVSVEPASLIDVLKRTNFLDRILIMF
jgi:hypothetical protein